MFVMVPVLASLLVVASALSREQYVPLERSAPPAASERPTIITGATSLWEEEEEFISGDSESSESDQDSEWDEEDGEDMAMLVPLNQWGYEEVAKSQDLDQMKAFVRRILETESRSVKDEAGLSGLVPYYSGDHLRNIWDLKHELREQKNAWWIEEGKARSAALNEYGYSQVASLKDDKQMKAFIRRVLAARGLQVRSDGEGMLSGIVPYFSGKVMTQTFRELVGELEKAKWVTSREGGDAGQAASLNQVGYASLVKSCQVAEMKVYIARLLESEARVVKDAAGFANYLEGGCRHRDLESLKRELRSFHCARWVGDGPGRAAPLSERGYRQVVEARSNKQMKAYIRRLIAVTGKSVDNEGDFSGVVPYYSGVGRKARSWKELGAMIKTAPWLA